MGRILAIDYGMKRTGLAVSDVHKIIATALETVPSEKLMAYLKTYFQKEPVEQLVVGFPRKLNNTDTDMTQPVRDLVRRLESEFPDKPVVLVDERFTSSMAMQSMIAGGVKKKDRRIKENVDKVSATIILQSYMLSKSIRG